MPESLATAAAADARSSGYLKYLNKSSYIVRNLDNSAVEAYYDQRTPTISHHSIPTTSFHQIPPPATFSTASHHHHHHHLQHQQQPTWSTHQTSSTTAQGQAYYSDMEKLVREAPQPIETSSTREIVNLDGIGGGYLLNKAELDNWRGELPLDKYPINTNFSDAEIIRKKLDKVHYVQEFGVRYLKPPAIQAPPIIIRERTSSVPPAPPLIIRQEADLTTKQKTLIFREHPPTPPHIPPVEIEVDGGKAGYHARRVVVEKMSKLPERPPNIIIEKWLQYRVPKRQVKFLRSSSTSFIPRNLIIEWEAPGVKITRKCKDLGVHHQDPAEYVRLYGAELKNTNELPTCDDGRFNQTVVATTRPAFDVKPVVVETRPAVVEPPTFSTSSQQLRFVTQRPDCPCTSACNCACHSGGYWTSNGDCNQVQQQTTTSIVQATFTSSNNCNCCCEPQQAPPRAPSPLPPPVVQAPVIPPAPVVVQNNSTCVCCCHGGSFGGGGYYISEQSGCCCETPAPLPPAPVPVVVPPPAPVVQQAPSSCTCCCTNTSLPPVVNIPAPVVSIPQPIPPLIPVQVPQPSSELCCCRSGVASSSTHLTDCHQMSAINGKCPIHYGNQYGSANYSTGGEQRYNVPELVGDVGALSLVADRLDQYGLGQYRDLVNRIQTTSTRSTINF